MQSIPGPDDAVRLGIEQPFVQNYEKGFAIYIPGWHVVDGDVERVGNG